MTSSAGPLPEALVTATASLTVNGPQAMRETGRRLAALLRPGDLVLLTGELGAGKTTLTRGIGEGLGVRGAVTSPTFVIARVHPSLGEGPPLVHVDAYRLGGAGLDEMDDLDLDVALPESVVVVEWGEDRVEELSEARLHVRIHRSVGTGDDGPGGPGDGGGNGENGENGENGGNMVRRLMLTGVGPRWHGVDLSALA